MFIRMIVQEPSRGKIATKTTLKMKTVTVTQEDISLGYRANVISCPVARALKRAYQSEHIFVCTVSFTDPDNMIRFLPKHVTQFIKAFDKGLKVEPMTFKV